MEVNLKIIDVSSLPSLLALTIGLIIFQIKQLNLSQFLILMSGLEGTALLASSISFSPPPIGQGVIGRLQWLLLEFPNYGSPCSFNILRFYLGLLFIFLSTALNFTI